MFFLGKLAAMLFNRLRKTIRQCFPGCKKVVPFVWVVGMIVEFFGPIVVMDISIPFSSHRVITGTETGDGGIFPVALLRVVKQWHKALALLVGVRS